MAEEGIAGGTGSPGAEGSAPSGGSSGASATPGLDWSTFRASLGDLGKDKSFDTYNDVKGLAKSHVELNKMIGNSLRLPKKDSPPEEREKAIKEIMGKLKAEGILEGTPETPDKYDIKVPKQEGWKSNDNLIKSFKEHSHKTGKSPSQVQADFDWFINYQAEEQRQKQMEFENAKQSLKSEFGGLYIRKMEAARRAAAKHLGEDGDALISDLPPKAGARILKALAEIGDPLLEGAMVAGEIPGVVTADQLTAKINLMMNDKKHPLNDISHLQHKDAVSEYTKLQQDFIRLQGRKGGR